VARLNADGTLDPSVPAQPVRFEFSHNATGSQSEITAVALQADGKIVVAGVTPARQASSAACAFFGRLSRTSS